MDYLKDITFEDTKDAIGGIFSGALKTLDRPRGAAIAALKLENPIKGFESPEKYSGGDVLGIQRISNPTLRKVVGVGADVVLDPLNIAAAFIPVGGEAFIGSRLIGAAARRGALEVGAREGAGLFSKALAKDFAGRIGEQYAIGAGARGFGEAAYSATEDTNLPTPVKTGINLTAGIAGGILGGRVGGGLRGPALRTAPTKLGMVEEQFNEPGADYFTHLDRLKTQAGMDYKTVDGKGITTGLYNTYEEAMAAATASGQSIQLTGLTLHDNPLLQEIARNQNPQFDIPIGIGDEKFIDRGVHILPADNAPKDNVLNSSHDQFYHTFDTFETTNPEVHKVLSNWISGTYGEQGTLVRNAFVEGSPIANTLYSAGEEWRQWARKQNTPFVQNGKVFLYRGERNFLESGKTIPLFESNFSVMSMTSEPSIAKGFNETLKLKDYPDNFILGKWVPIDDIIGPVGHKMGEKEFLVFDRAQVSDDVFKQYTGVSKDAPYGTKVYSVFDTQDGSQVRTFDTESAARAYVDNPQFKTEEVSGYIYAHPLYGRKIIGPKELDYIKNDKLNNVAYSVENKATNLHEYWTQSQYDTVKVLSSDINKHYLIHKLPEMKLTPIYGDKILLYGKEDSLAKNIKFTSSLSKAYDEGQLVLKETPSQVQRSVDYLPVERGSLPDVPKVSEFTPEKLVQLYPRLSLEGNDKYVIVNYTPNLDLGFANLADATKQVKQGATSGSIIPMEKYLEDNAPHLGMFGSDIPPMPPIEPPTAGGGGNLGNPFGDNSNRALVPVPGTLKNASTLGMTPEQIAQSQMNIDPVAGKLFNDVMNTGEAGVYGNVVIAPPEGLKTATQAEALKGVGVSTPEIVGDINALDPAIRIEAERFYLNKMAIDQPTEELIKLFEEGFQKAGKADPSFIGRANAIMRGVWATGDGSWFGIQGLLTIPRLLATGNFKDVVDLMVIPQLTLVGNKKAFGEYLKRTISTLPEGAPSLLEAQSSGLHLSFLQGNPDFDMRILERLTRGIINPDMAFATAGDIGRISMFYSEWARFGKPTGVELTKLSRAINRATGIAEKPFGGYVGSFALFAPRFFQSQLEIIAKAFSSGDIENALARRQLMTLIGTGSMLTVAANYVRGYTDTDQFNPTSPNFMRVRNVAGQDISVFGPWDSLLKLMVHLGQGDITYAQTKASPIINVALNIIQGHTFLNEPFDIQHPANVAKSMLLPFAWQNIGRETPVGSALGFFGVKSSPQSASEIREANMRNLGMDPTDPLQVREYLAEHPEHKTLFTESQRAASEVQGDIKARNALNDIQTINNSQTLVTYRDNRTILQREQRNKLDVILKNSDFKADTQKRQWIDSYYKLFDQARDSITHDVLGPKLDQLQAQWVKDNGIEAYTYLQDYNLVGKTATDLAYLQDMQKLNALNYFNIPKYVSVVYKSGLTDDQIEQYRNKVSALRSTNPQLASVPFNVATMIVFKGELSNAQIQALDMAGKDDYASPQVKAIKKQYPELFVWFNPNATWSTRESLINKPKPSGTLAIPTVSQVGAQLAGSVR